MRALVPIALLAIAAAVPRHDPNAATISAAKAAVASKLRDPSSAQFRGIVVRPGQLDGKAVCGEVNAKNGFGGYSGFERFVYETAIGDARFEDGKDQMFYVYAADCSANRSAS